MISINNPLGFGFKTKNYITFFGNRSAELTQLESEFTEFSFLRVRQTHSNIVIPSSEVYTEADAHYTHIKNHALVIATADCMPIMIYCQQTNRVAAVHAGWRGVVNGVLIKTLLELQKTGSTEMHFIIFVGPSISQNSFEVDEDVFLQLSKSANKLKAEDFSFQKNKKYYVNLNKIVEIQIADLTQKAEIFFSNIDTKTDLNFHSYRRGKLTSERNLSFIALI